MHRLISGMCVEDVTDYSDIVKIEIRTHFSHHSFRLNIRAILHFCTQNKSLRDLTSPPRTMKSRQFVVTLKSSKFGFLDLMQSIQVDP